MGKPMVGNLAARLAAEAKKHMPEIFAGVGVASLVGATVMAVRATLRGEKLVEEKKEELGRDDLTPKETVETVWKCYVPAGFLTIAGVGLIFASTAVGRRRSAALAAACTFAESSFGEYREKVADIFGDDGEERVSSEVARERLRRRKPDPEPPVLGDEESEYTARYFDVYSGQDFKSDKNTFDEAVNKANAQLIDNGYLSLNDFYEYIGVKPTKLGDTIGWNICKGLVTIDRYPQIMENGVPYIVIDYLVAPIYDYDQWL